jgi:hypothetical protein
MKPNKEKSIELQLRVIGIFQDTIMQNRWKEYQSLHKRIMTQVIENPEYIDLCDKQRDLEGVISHKSIYSGFSITCVIILLCSD